MSEPRITPVILSGGSGTRLWPLSTAARPKQLHALTGEATMLQLAIERVRDESLFAPPIVVASERHADEVERQLAEAGVAAAVVILEPCARNTAAAIALAALHAAPESLLLVLPSDQVVADQAAFRTAVAKAAEAARKGWMVTFGIEAERPETGYGYIRRGEEVVDGVYAVDRFIEKPDAETARRLVADGAYFWNGGIFLFAAGQYLQELTAHAPDILTGVEQAWKGAERSGVRLVPHAQRFAETRSESIDYAVMEKAERVAVVPVSMGWSDLGSWDALYDLRAADAAPNVCSGAVLALDSHGNLLHSTGPAIVTVGIENLVVIATDRAVMIVPRGQTQAVKRAVDALREQGHEALEE